MVKTIKGIDQDSWNRFKSMAARNDMKLGEFFTKMIREYELHAKQFWNDALENEKILTDAEAETIEQATRRIREEYGFR